MVALRFALVFTLGVFCVSCGQDSDGLAPPPGELQQSSLPRETAPEVPSSDAAELVSGNNAFAADMYRQLGAADGNLIYSPFSVSTALAMTYGGARTTTEAEMASVLHFTLPQARLHRAFNWLDLTLASRGEGAAGADGAPFRLRVANATFGQVGYQFLPEYLDVLALHYGAGMALLDFNGQPEASRGAINDWVAGRTEDRIPELLAPGVIRTDTRLVLVNAIYFNASWATQFTESATAPAVFHTLDGDVSAPTMRGSETASGAAQTQAYDAVTLPYDGEEIEMLIVAPAAGTLEAFESQLDAAAIAAIRESISPAFVDLSLPTFEFRFQAGLVPPFQALGMEAAFTNADFSGMDGTRNLVITDVVHEAYIKVNERGTEAAAATAVVVGETSAPETVRIAIDRPFLFFIRDIETGTILFMGRVTDPTA